MLSYKMLLNILILFLCTSCCACHGECDDDIDFFYLRVFEDGENVISKYELGSTNDSFKPNKVYFTNQENVDIDAFIYVRGDYLSVRMSTDFALIEGDEYKLWIKNKSIGNVFVKTKSKDKHAFECCGGWVKIETFESRTDSVTIIKNTQEEQQPFYEVQF